MLRRFCAGLGFLVLTGCGYVGPVLPPSPMLPQAVNDLTVIERGDQLVIHFDVPPRTTDNLVIRDYNAIDLRIGPDPVPFDFGRWAGGATRLNIESPPETDPDNPAPIALGTEVPAQPWVGKRIAVAVRTSVRKNDHFSSWSNRVVLEVLPPLAPPVVKAESTAKGVLLSWSPRGADLEYRVYRKTGTEGSPLLIGTSPEPEYLDTSSQYDTPYEYSVVAVKGNVESLPSAATPITTKDIFPPAAPTGVSALAGPTSIEVSWQRNTEPDLKGYFVYRSVDNGPAQQIGTLITVPAYSDRDIQRGKTYRYQITAVDQHNNPSAKSEPVQVTY